MVCLRNISVHTLHKGDTEDDDDDNNNNNTTTVHTSTSIVTATTINTAIATIPTTTTRPLMNTEIKFMDLCMIGVGVGGGNCLTT
jgi:hypothetical protein